MGYRKLSVTRPRHHAQAEGAIEAFKKNFPTRLDEVAHETGLGVESIEIWFQDEARIGQKNKITRRWAKRGTRRTALPRDQRTASTLYFRCRPPPKERQGRGSAILPDCNTAAMNLHLAGDRCSHRAQCPCRPESC